MQSVRIRDGIIGKRPGLRDFNGSSALAGTPVSIFEFRRENSSIIETVVVTGGAALSNRRIYKSASSAWSDITDATLTNGDGTNDLQGGALEPYDAAIAPIPSQIDVLYMSNGNIAASPLNPEIIKWTGSGNAVAMTAGPGSARCLATFANRLFLGHVFDTSAGAVRGNRVAWSADGDSETWSGASSGAVDLVETPDHVTRLLTLRNRLVIYKARSIFVARETGISTVPVGFELVTRDLGSLCGFSAASIGDRHFFLSDDNVYEFDGNVARPIGNAIRRDLRSINLSQPRQIFSMIDSRTSEYWLFVPEGSETVPTHAWIYNYAEEHWSRWEVPQVTAGSRGVSGSAALWSDFPVPSGPKWSDFGAKSWEEFAVSGAPILLLARTDLTTDEITDQVLADGSAAIDAFWESPDVDFAGQPDWSNQPLSTADSKTLTRVEVRYGGTGQASSLTCEISTDGGRTFIFSTTSPLTADGGVVYFDTWVTGQRFRVRLRNAIVNQPFGALQEIVMRYMPQSTI